MQGNVLRCLDDYEQAAACYNASVTLLRELGNRGVIAAPLHNLGFVALHQGDDTIAAAYFEESLEFALQGDHDEVTTCLAGLAGLAAARGHFEQAARLFGAVEMLLTASGEDHDPSNRMACDSSLALVRGQLEEDTFAMAWAAGQAMTLEQAITYVLEEADSS